MNIPKDPVMLLSFLNLKLRDEYRSLDDLCKSLCIDKELEKTQMVTKSIKQIKVIDSTIVFTLLLICLKTKLLSPL